MEKLKQIRKKLNWTQQELADFLGLSKSQVSLYESGLRGPTYKRLIEIRDKLGVKNDELID